VSSVLFLNFLQIF